MIRGLPFTLLSQLVGWWGIPLGIIYTIQVLIVNPGVENDVPAEAFSALGQAVPPQNIQPS